jgi:hypothetical protein
MKKVFAIIVVAMATMFSCVIANAQEVKKESPWVEVQVVAIPFGQTVFTGVTKNGNPKAGFEFGDLKVTVSNSNAAKYSNQQVELVLVKWQHKEDTTKVKYTTRQKNGRKASTTHNVDITKLF